MLLNFNKKFLKYSVLVLLIIELASFLGYYFDVINVAVFLLILLATLVLSLKKFEYGLYIILAELFVGSSGYLFSLDFSSFSLSLRIGLFLVVMAVWLFKLIKTRKLEFRNSNLFRWYWLLIIFLGWGFINGLLADRNFSDIFFDINAYIYFALIFAFFDGIRSWQQVKTIYEIMLASLIILSAKAVFYYFVYAADLRFFSIDLYHWQRSTEGGQLAHLGHNLYRILFLSDIYPLMAIFIFGAIYLYFRHKKIEFNKFNKKLVGAAILLSCLIIVLSFFRSFWAALVLTLIFGIIFLIKKVKIKSGKTLLLAGLLVILLVLEVGIVFGVSQGLQKYVVKHDLITQKDIFSSDDPGIVGRLSLLRPLVHKFLEKPMSGHGFGTTVSFLTTDPRHFNKQYITYAFEWGYLDIAIKIGLVGLLVYIWFILRIFLNGCKLIDGEDKEKQAVVAGLLLGLVALVLTHGVSPYLNHPLGIGYLMFLAASFHALQNSANSTNSKRSYNLLPTNYQLKHD